MATFGERLRRLRQDAELSQRELGKSVNLNQSTVAYYELGRKEPSHATIKRIAEFFNISTDYLLGVSDDPRPDRNLNEKIATLFEIVKRAQDLPDEDVAQVADTLEALIEHRRSKAGRPTRKE